MMNPATRYVAEFRYAPTLCRYENKIIICDQNLFNPTGAAVIGRYLKNYVNVIATDALVHGVARTPAAMVWSV